MRPNTLQIKVNPFRGIDAVDLLVDGHVLGDRGAQSRLTAAELLTSHALLPGDPPRRIALYGCDCGELGCGNVTAIVERDGWLVRWRDFVSVTGWPYRAIPDVLDPALEEEFVHPLDLPDVAFAADEYIALVGAATERSVV